MKSEVSVERLAEARGIKLERHGTDLLGLCPFHDDKEPSLVITPSKNLWHCLGACRTGGSVIDWVMKCQGVSFRHAVELLRADHPSLAAAGRVVSKGTTSAVKLEAPFAAGHSSVAVTERYYAKFRSESAAKAVLSIMESRKKSGIWHKMWHRGDNLSVAEFRLLL